MSYLTEKEIEHLRQCIESPNWPLSYDKWPYELNKFTNCLAFALGLPIKNKDIFQLSLSPFSKLEYLIEHLMNISGLEYRKITTPEEAKSDEFVIQGYEWRFNGDYWFHVIRRNLDGKWVHKEGFLRGPTQISNFDFVRTMCNPQNLSCIFAVKKKAS